MWVYAPVIVIRSYLADLLTMARCAHATITSATRVADAKQNQQELEPNDLLTAAAMLWGAVVPAIKHIAPRYVAAILHSHRQIKPAVPAIDEPVPNVNPRQFFGNGEALAAIFLYFYRVQLAGRQVQNSFRQRQRLPDALLA